MDIKQHRIRIDIGITPKWYHSPPMVTVDFMDHEVYHGRLSANTTFKIDKMLSPGPAWITVNFHNKQYQHTNFDLGHDEAVIINNITINDINDPKFILEGLYTPDYPLQWFQEQVQKGSVPQPVLKHQTYMGWNGQWRLNITVPIFTWIHQVQNLGWIYD